MFGSRVRFSPESQDNMPNKNFKVIKVYDKTEAPEDAEFWYSAVEENGMLDIKVRDYSPLKLNQKYVHFYKVYKNRKK
jgi:hypothetical protein